jgi:SNF2 family DNA or RNA helicase
MLGTHVSMWHRVRAAAAWLNTCNSHVQEASLIKRFKAFSQPPAFVKPTDPAKLVQLLVDGTALPTFKNGRKLRDYQETSFKWMVQHNLQGQGCVLGDEMGLGKTAQARLCLLQQTGVIAADWRSHSQTHSRMLCPQEFVVRSCVQAQNYYTCLCA